MTEHWERDGDCDRLHIERFQPIIGAERRRARRGRHDPLRSTAASRRAATAPQPILVAGEEAGATLPFGCRMGICHTCVGRSAPGRIRDLRTGEVSGSAGEMVRTCVNAPEGAVEIAL